MMLMRAQQREAGIGGYKMSPFQVPVSQPDITPSIGLCPFEESPVYHGEYCVLRQVEEYTNRA